MRLLDARPAYPQTEAALKQWLEDTQKALDGFLFAVQLLDGDDLIGYVEFDGILWSYQVGWLSIAIGDRAHRGKGYGFEAMQLALGFAFGSSTCIVCSSPCLATMSKLLRCTKSLGFSARVYIENVCNVTAGATICICMVCCVANGRLEARDWRLGTGD